MSTASQVVCSMSLDKGRLTHLVQDKLGWPKELIASTMIDYEAFLAECKASPDVFRSPTLLVDDIWHLHILDTKHYMQFCNGYFGYYLHHTPIVDGLVDPDTERCNAGSPEHRMYDTAMPIRAKCGGGNNGDRCFSGETNAKCWPWNR